MGGFGGIGMVLWIVVLVAAVWWITQTATGQKTQESTQARPQVTRGAREVLDERLARGEITTEQHRELRKALE